MNVCLSYLIDSLKKLMQFKALNDNIFFVQPIVYSIGLFVCDQCSYYVLKLQQTSIIMDIFLEKNFGYFFSF